MNFSFHRFWAVFVARNREFFRDLGALGWVFAFPFLLLFSFHYVFNVDHMSPYKVAWISPAQPEGFRSLEEINLTELDSALEKLRFHKVDLVIQLQNGQYEIWQNRQSPRSQLAWLLLKGEWSQELPRPVQLRQVTGQAIRYADWLLPGLIAMNLLWMSLWGVGWVIVRHRKLGILKRLKASPVTAFEYLLAQILSRLIVLAFTGLVTFVGAYLISPYPIVGSLWDLGVLYMVGCFCHCAIGMIIAARMQSEELANGLLNLITYPMIFVSEIWFSLEGSPAWVIELAHWTPLWHLSDGMRRILFEGANLAQLSGSLWIFSLLSGLSLMIGSWLFRWNPD